MMERIIREDECRQLTSLGRSTRRRMEIEGKFPCRIQLGPNSVGWRLSEITEWLESRAPAKKSAA